VSALLALLRGEARDALTGEEWNGLLGHARRARMLPRLETSLRGTPLLSEAPRAARDVLESARIYTDYIQQRLRFEVERLGLLCEGLDFPVILLKGAAYIATGGAAAAGRVVRDIDILVRRKHLDHLEEHLRRRGWAFKETLTDYDEYYYRELSHELPPLRHADFDFELDVHHSLLVPTHRLRADVDAVFDGLEAVPGSPFFVLDARDQLIHSATHLLTGEEISRGLRDLHDISLLARSLQARGTDAAAILQRATDLGLREPTFDALHACARHLGIEGADVLEARDARSIARRSIAWGLDQLAFVDNEFESPAQRLARGLIWTRAQATRMPLGTLLRHTAYKSLSGPRLA